LRQAPEGVAVPSEIRYRKYAETGFATPSGLVEIFSEILQSIGQAPLPEYVEPATGPISRPDLVGKFPLVLTSAKSMHYCHSQHRSLPALRKREPDPRVELHPAAAEERGIVDGDWIRVVTPHGEMRGRAHLKQGLDPRVVSATAGWWQACRELDLPAFDEAVGSGANLNAIIGNEASDPISGSVPHRSYLCDVSLLETA
jgi:anaerobic selenocysteine-containing dehydrogenase